MLMELDEISSDEGSTRDWALARPGTVGRALGEVAPIEGAKQVAILASDGTGGDKGGQGKVGMGEGQGPRSVERSKGWVSRRCAVEEVDHRRTKRVEGVGQLSYHDHVSTGGG